MQTEAETQWILTAPPARAQQAAAWGLPVGHMAYRVGPGARLLRSNIPPDLRGGLMVLDGGGFDGRGDPAPFCQQVLRECACRDFHGVILDLEGPPQPLLGQIVSRLGQLLSRRGWPLYVPEAYAPCSDQAKIVLPSALSGGSLVQRLSEGAERYGAGRVALGVQRVAEDFTLPSPTGSGVPLSREELDRRVRARGAATFFSDELCARYFTYLSRNSGAHFVLYDDAGSIRKKLHVARQLGLYACILAWPEVDDILPALLS
jgi:hypothetical protein